MNPYPHKCRFRVNPKNTPKLCRKISNFKPLQYDSGYAILFIQTRY